MSLDVDVMREALVDTPDSDDEGEWRPRLAEFNLTNYLLLQAVNLLGVQAQGKQVNKIAPLRGPKTAEDIVRAEHAARAAFSIIAHVTPHALKGGRPDG